MVMFASQLWNHHEHNLKLVTVIFQLSSSSMAKIMKVHTHAYIPTHIQLAKWPF